MFGKTQTVQVSAETKVFEVKELVRAAKASEAEAALASAHEALAQLESEMAQAPGDKARAAALEAERLAAAGEVARLEAQAAEAGSVEYVDAMALLYNQDTLDDDSTVGSHGLTESTTVTLSMAQDPERGRAMRRERGERALREAEEQQRRAVEEREAEEERERREREQREADARAAAPRKAKRWALLLFGGAAVQQVGLLSLYSDLGLQCAQLGGASMLVGALGFDCGVAGHSEDWRENRCVFWLYLVLYALFGALATALSKMAAGFALFGGIVLLVLLDVVRDELAAMGRAAQ